MQGELEMFESSSGKNKKVDDSRQEERFLFNVTLDDLNKFKEGESPANTVKSNMWALNENGGWLEMKLFPMICALMILCFPARKISAIGYVNL